jgi:cell division FtsZ-interacting protein ZapD
MTPRNAAVGSKKSSRNQGEQLKDEVYRQMFRLEESRPGAEMGLALALLHAWLAADSKSESGEERDWLKKVSPICLQMIETALKAGVATIPCAKGHS